MRGRRGTDVIIHSLVVAVVWLWSIVSHVRRLGARAVRMCEDRLVCSTNHSWARCHLPTTLANYTQRHTITLIVGGDYWLRPLDKVIGSGFRLVWSGRSIRDYILSDPPVWKWWVSLWRAVAVLWVGTPPVRALPPCTPI